MIAPRAAMPSGVSSKQASLPDPLRTNSPSPTSRRRHERTCSAVCPQACATGYSSEARMVPSSPTMPNTSVLVGISTVGSATIVILTTGPRPCQLELWASGALWGREASQKTLSGGEDLAEAVALEEARRRVVGGPGDLLARVGAHE